MCVSYTYFITTITTTGKKAYHFLGVYVTLECPLFYNKSSTKEVLSEEVLF